MDMEHEREWAEQLDTSQLHQEQELSVLVFSCEPCKMIQDQTVVVTIDISDLQADLPLFGACTSGRPEDENLITLVDPNTLSPLVAEKQIVSEPPAQQEEVISVQEVPQSEIIVETVEDSLHCSIDEEASLEVPLDESETCSQTDDVSDVNLMSDDLASLLSEDLDDDLEKAAKDALSQQSLRPILKEELKTIIQHRRVRVGKGELKLDESRKRPAPDSEEEKEVKSFWLQWWS